jgi:predicted O-methyltransferase YrrM
MKDSRSVLSCLVVAAALASLSPGEARGQSAAASALDTRARAFLERTRGEWNDMNVPYADGQFLHDLVIRKGWRRGLEIGTSTGHSGIWIAWAMAKTGGKLVTIEIDERRHQEALRNFEAAGVAAFVDARRADAHALVKELPGPFDFVFSDADKDWYTQYFKDLEAKMAVGGCFTAHNVLDGFQGIQAFLDYVRARPNYETTIDRSSRSGISVSCRTR